MVVPIDDGRRLYPERKTSLADYLLTLPSFRALRTSRNPKPLRDVDL